jgi:hypothetical protein
VLLDAAVEDAEGGERVALGALPLRNAQPHVPREEHRRLVLAHQHHAVDAPAEPLPRKEGRKERRERGREKLQQVSGGKAWNSEAVPTSQLKLYHLPTYLPGCGG